MKITIFLKSGVYWHLEVSCQTVEILMQWFNAMAGNNRFFEGQDCFMFGLSRDNVAMIIVQNPEPLIDNDEVLN
jgi:hypothetical protein